MNSAALRFIPKEDLDKKGYGQYRKLSPEESGCHGDKEEKVSKLKNIQLCKFLLKPALTRLLSLREGVFNE